MIFDIHTALGHWPFRQVPHQSASELRHVLEDAGIEGAAAANSHGLFYKNCHDANLELTEWLAPHGDFFTRIATLNPLYAAWERDLRTCVQDLGLRGVRLAPQYHGYALGCDESVALAKGAADLGLPVLVPHRLVDVRQHHWMDTERTVDMAEVAALCRAVPEARIVYTESRAPTAELLDDEGSWRYPGLYLESSRLDLHDLPEPVAAERAVFGTGAPFKHVTPALLKLNTSDLTPAARQRIAGANGPELLGLSSD